MQKKSLNENQKYLNDHRLLITSKYLTTVASKVYSRLIISRDLFWICWLMVAWIPSQKY